MRLPFPRFKSRPVDNSDSGNHHAALDRRSIAIEHLLYKGICQASDSRSHVDRSNRRDESQTDVQMKLIRFTISLNEHIRGRGIDALCTAAVEFRKEPSDVGEILRSTGPLASNVASGYVTPMRNTNVDNVYPPIDRSVRGKAGIAVKIRARTRR